MEPEVFEQMYRLEDRHWWFVGQRRLVRRLVKGAPSSPTMTLDAGCGTGAVLKMLQVEGAAVGVDSSLIALGYCRERGLGSLCRASLDALPFADGSFDLITLLGVLYHADVADDAAVVDELHRVCRQGGRVVLSEPAFEFMRSAHDVAEHTARRYTTGRLRRLVTAAGFRIEKLSYFNMFLFPLLLIRRTFQRAFAPAASRSDLTAAPRLVNWALTALLRLEVALMAAASLPFGSTVICLARKG